MSEPIQASLPIIGPAPLVVGPVFLCFELEGKPGHKGRHRSRIVFPKNGKAFVHNYPDPATEAYENVLREYAGLLMRHRQPTTRPVALVVHAFREIPKSWPTRDREAALVGATLPTSKPDADNYLKVVDALNQIVWVDDSQVVDGRCIKVYSDRPALRIEVREFVEP